MIRKLSLATALLCGFAAAAVAAETVTPTVDASKPAADAVVVPMATGAADATATVTTIAMTEDQGKAWIDKAVYSSDGKNVGEVASFQRDANNMVIGMQADIGGFLGMGETRVAVTAAQFKLQGDRIVLALTAEQTKVLPKVAI